MSTQVIAARLFVTDRTIEAHISANLHKPDLGESPDFGGRRRRVFTQLAALSGARPGDRVLDVGCGTGAFTRVMAEADTFRGTVLGVDPSREVIARARRLTRHADCTLEGIAERPALTMCVRETRFDPPWNGLICQPSDDLALDSRHGPHPSTCSVLGRPREAL
jgi:SAM-dependent methyltransferase